MNKRRIPVGWIVAVLVILLPSALFFHFVVSIEVPHVRPMLTCNAAHLETAFTLPPGSHYDLILGVPVSASPSIAFKGRVSISQSGRVLRSFPIASNNASGCNWLHRPDQAGYIVTWQRPHAVEMDTFLESRQSYNLSVTFTKTPPPGSSLWLSWLQRWRD